MKNFRPLVVIVFLLAMVTTVDAQAQKSSGAASANGLDRLAKKTDWGALHLRLFRDTASEIEISLATSWIPGENRKGMFRYKLEAHPVYNEEIPATVDSNEKLLERVHACDLNLRLSDADDFELRTIPLLLQRTVNSSLMLISLNANSSVPMSAAEYRSFIGNPNHSGQWNISWNCHDDPPK